MLRRPWPQDRPNPHCPRWSQATATTVIPHIDRTGRIRPVRRHRNQTDIALRLAPMAVIGPNHHQAGIFALRSGIGLQRNGRKSGDVGQPGFKLLE